MDNIKQESPVSSGGQSPIPSGGQKRRKELGRSKLTQSISVPKEGVATNAIAVKKEEPDNRPTLDTFICALPTDGLEQTTVPLEGTCSNGHVDVKSEAIVPEPPTIVPDIEAIVPNLPDIVTNSQPDTSTKTFLLPGLHHPPSQVHIHVHVLMH